MNILEDILSGAADNTILPPSDNDEYFLIPSEAEGIASYWISVGNYIREAMRSNEQGIL